MKTLADYSEEIYKCTKCGLCQSVCPVFEVTGIESAVSRGKFTLLNAALSGKIKFNSNLSKYLDKCLGCKACYDFCPSGICAQEIINAAKIHSYKLNGVGFLKQFIVSNFGSKFKLSLLNVLLSVYKRMGLIKLTDFIASELKPLANIITIFNMQLKENIKYKKLNVIKPKSELKIVYFPGCINLYVNSSVKNAVLMVLEKNGFKVNIPDGFSCCGVPALSSGDKDGFIKLAKYNLDKIDSDIDFLITDCASCGSVWDTYKDVLDGEMQEKARSLSEKVININKFLMLNSIYIPENTSVDRSITYHDPCHLKRYQGVYEEPRELLRMIPGIKYVELENADKCCGSAGTFCINNPDISREISINKAKDILNTEVNTVSTSCPSCKIGITQGLMHYDNVMPIYQPVELLAELYLSES